MKDNNNEFVLVGKHYEKIEENNKEEGSLFY